MCREAIVYELENIIPSLIEGVWQIANELWEAFDKSKEKGNKGFERIEKVGIRS